ncbi:MAG: NUDIX hydrolase [Campylobacterota bacterium]|nr:NUDIX hydrolase [Campylobacterota bacterium]
MNVCITNFKTTALDETHFVHPVKITYEQNGQPRVWEAVKSHDSVAVLLYHVQKQAFVLVKQFRPPVHLTDSNFLFTYELCAGIVDKQCSLVQIAKEEIDEECGYNVPLHKIEKITSFFTNVGVSGSKQHLYFAQVDQSMKVHEGGGIHTEQIELEYLPLSVAEDFIYDETKAKTPGLMFAFMWFFKRYK